ncbi:MAG: motility protein A [Desulfobacteraceae bacterium]|nr:MAG: motility protein A [Desulfobacteraceae bacterium]
MDIATLLGTISAFGLVILAIFMGGGLSLFINPPSLMIVVGGTLGATMINYPLRDVLGALTVVKNVFFTKPVPIGKVAGRFVTYAGKARREGILSLESEVQSMPDDFLKKGLQLSIDGTEPHSIQEILETEIDFLRERHQLGAEIFTTMGSFAPALGMIGTLIGLVQMLQSMDDPNSIGPAMAVALLTTFYGSVLANLVFMPIAGKLRTRSKEEILIKEMIVQGVISLSRGDNPRLIEQKLLSFLAPKFRESAFN